VTFYWPPNDHRCHHIDQRTQRHGPPERGSNEAKTWHGKYWQFLFKLIDICQDFWPYFTAIYRCLKSKIFQKVSIHVNKSDKSWKSWQSWLKSQSEKNQLKKSHFKKFHRFETDFQQQLTDLKGYSWRFDKYRSRMSSLQGLICTLVIQVNVVIK
jgi:hypothetical protein